VLNQDGERCLRWSARRTAELTYLRTGRTPITAGGGGWFSAAITSQLGRASQRLKCRVRSDEVLADLVRFIGSYTQTAMIPAGSMTIDTWPVEYRPQLPGAVQTRAAVNLDGAPGCGREYIEAGVLFVLLHLFGERMFWLRGGPGDLGHWAVSSADGGEAGLKAISRVSGNGGEGGRCVE